MLRNSILNARHKELGSTLDGETWNDMPIPWSYKTDPHEEVIAVRTRAALYDVSALNLVNVTGPDARAVVDQLVAIDVSQLQPGSSRLAAEVDDSGALCDDIMVICDADDQFRLSHGSGKTPQQLARLAEGKNVDITPDLDVHILSLQGPKSLDVLNPHLDIDLATLPYFKHIDARLFGTRIQIARGGYSGERGYEIYCKANDAVRLWDLILENGKAYGVIAASWDSLELTRIEAGLLFFPYEMPEGDTTPWEVNMGWCVDVDKPGDYIGKAAVLAARGKERFKQSGIICQSNSAVEAGAKITRNGEVVGVVTSASYSRYLMQSLALVHLRPDCLQLGTEVQVEAATPVKAYVAKTPFYDPMRMRTHPEQQK
ncbi:glycine cleavage t protein (aminomethyl transferase) [Methylophaga lonarensis MPL]|uniref:Glycine cleavage t protein (Aminomethyl transferase) n=1 Tax=Methylophaga lonarensis MPL TaxID=1286106 RepID=M7P1Y2_9GAMM|nr:aminomethyltransferase family protein [Methylophaga lonarensis]EMR13506.1 glycine cleavage t protein (aminomethyl transferase) [Methylophaga lonarensis MPL]